MGDHERSRSQTRRHYCTAFRHTLTDCTCSNPTSSNNGVLSICVLSCVGGWGLAVGSVIPTKCKPGNSRPCATTVCSITQKDQYLSNSMEYSSSCKVGSYKAKQGTPNILLNPQVRYSVHSSFPLVLILSQINPRRTLPPYVFKIYFLIILPQMPGSSKWSLCSGFPHQIPACTFSPHMPPQQFLYPCN